MKTPVVVITATLVGATLGAAISWANFGSAPRFVIDAQPAGAAVAGPLTPKAVVDNPIHDFGPVSRDIKARHYFRFTNAGEAPLVLTAGVTSCSRCTIATLLKPELKPGESTEVRVEYLTTIEHPHFRQTATIHTNDPERPRVELEIFGHVVSDYQLVPPFVQLGKLAVTETKTVEVKLVSSIAGTVKLVDYSFEDEELAAYFEMKTEPLAPEDVGGDVADGYRLLVTLRPGLPLGPVRQTINLELSVSGREKNPIVGLNVQGTVDSDVSIVGPGWNSELHLLKFLDVKGSQGARREMSVLVRGQDRHNLSMAAKSVEPEWLKVTVGEPEELASGAVTRYPLAIEVPPGTPPGNYSGTAQGKYAKIVLSTTHPQAKEVPIFVQLVVER